MNLARKPDFGTNVNRPTFVPGPEHNIWYWNPNRQSIRFAPEEFRARLKREMGEELDICWNPITERWQVWTKMARVQHPVCHGWRLLFVHQGPDGEYWPLDERLQARLYSCSAQVNGSGKQYFDRIVAEMARDKEKREKQHTQDTIDAAMPSFDHSKIQISMRGKSNGSKFADYLA